MAKERRPWPRCDAPLRSGEPCGRAVARGADGPEEFCAHHLANPPAVPVVGPIVVSDSEPGPSVDDVVVDESPAVVERIGSLREALRDGVLTSETAGLVQELILDGLRASREVWSTCPSCQKRHPVLLPDLGTRVKAAETLITQLEGRLAEVKDSGLVALEARAREIGQDIANAADEELQFYMAFAEAHGEPS